MLRVQKSPLLGLALIFGLAALALVLGAQSLFATPVAGEPIFVSPTP